MSESRLKNQEDKEAPLFLNSTKAFEDPTLEFVIAPESKRLFANAQYGQGFALIGHKVKNRVIISLVPAFNEDKGAQLRQDKFGKPGDKDGVKNEEGGFPYVESDQPLGMIGVGIIHNLALKYLQRTKQIPQDMPYAEMFGGGIWKGTANILFKSVRTSSATLNNKSTEWNKEFLLAFYYIEDDDIESYDHDSDRQQRYSFKIRRRLPTALAKKVYLTLISPEQELGEKEMQRTTLDINRTSQDAEFDATKPKYDPLKDGFKTEDEEWWEKNSHDPQAKNKKLIQTIYIAAMEDHVAVIESALEYIMSNIANYMTADRIANEKERLLNSRFTNKRNTPLHIAARWGASAAVKMLLAEDAWLRVENANFETPLSMAAAHSHITVVKQLIEYANAKFEKATFHDHLVDSIVALCDIKNAEHAKNGQEILLNYLLMYFPARYVEGAKDFTTLVYVAANMGDYHLLELLFKTQDRGKIFSKLYELVPEKGFFSGCIKNAIKKRNFDFIFELLDIEKLTIKELPNRSLFIDLSNLLIKSAKYMKQLTGKNVLMVLKMLFEVKQDETAAELLKNIQKAFHYAVKSTNIDVVKTFLENPYVKLTTAQVSKELTDKCSADVKELLSEYLRKGQSPSGHARFFLPSSAESEPSAIAPDANTLKKPVKK